MTGCLVDTRIEPDLEDLLWNIVNIFHRAGERIERDLDRNEQVQREQQREQDGSEIRSVELARKIAEGIPLTESRATMELFRSVEHTSELQSLMRISYAVFYLKNNKHKIP